MLYVCKIFKQSFFNKTKSVEICHKLHLTFVNTHLAFSVIYHLNQNGRNALEEALTPHNLFTIVRIGKLKYGARKGPQSAPGFFNPNQKVHGLFHFYNADMHKTVKNQLKKPSVIGLPKFTIVNWLKNTINMQILV